VPTLPWALLLFIAPQIFKLRCSKRTAVRDSARQCLSSGSAMATEHQRIPHDPSFIFVVNVGHKQRTTSILLRLEECTVLRLVN